MNPEGIAPAAEIAPGSGRAEREPVTAREAEEHAAAFRGLRESVARRIVGQDEVVRELLLAILAEGHCLIIGVPGLAKTLIVSTIAEALTLRFRRIQFTPDLMPSDITGATIISQEATGDRGYRFLRGPVFSNVLLADEINRTPPKTQSALMEAMEERQVTAGGVRLPIERPFFVLATQNPIEQEGTYPLPVSQTDRFMFNVLIDYPSEEEEFEILELTTSAYRAGLDPALDRDDIIRAISAARRAAIPGSLVDYASRIVRRTRPTDPSAPPFVREWLSWGAGPRAVQAIILGAKAGAILSGRPSVEPEDIHRVVLPTLRHRVLLSYHAEAEGVIPDAVIERILEGMPDGLYRKPLTDTPRRGILSRLFGKK